MRSYLLFLAVCVFGAFMGHAFQHGKLTAARERIEAQEIEKATLSNLLNGCRAEKALITADKLENTIETRGKLLEGEVDLQVFINDFFNLNQSAQTICFGRGWMTSFEKEID